MVKMGKFAAQLDVKLVKEPKNQLPGGGFTLPDFQ